MPTEDRKCLLRAKELNRLGVEECCDALSNMNHDDCLCLLPWIEPPNAAAYLRTVTLQEKLSYFYSYAYSSFNFSSALTAWHPDFVATLLNTLSPEESIPILVQMRPSKLVEVIDHMELFEIESLMSKMQPGDKAALLQILPRRVEKMIRNMGESFAGETCRDRQFPPVRRTLGRQHTATESIR